MYVVKQTYIFEISSQYYNMYVTGVASVKSHL